MSDREHDPIEPEDTLDAEPEDVTAEQPQAPKQLRDALKKAQQEAAEAKGKLLSQSYESIGLDPEQGLGRAVSMLYTGDGDDLEDFVAAEFDYHYTGPENPLLGQISREQARLDQAAAGAGSVPIRSEDDVLARAEAAGDVNTAMAIKSNQLTELIRRGGRR